MAPEEKIGEIKGQEQGSRKLMNSMYAYIP